MKGFLWLHVSPPCCLVGAGSTYHSPSDPAATCHRRSSCGSLLLLQGQRPPDNGHWATEKPILDHTRQAKCQKSKFTRKCANYANFIIATKQRNLSAITMFTTFTSLHNVLPWLCSLSQLWKLNPGLITLPSWGNFTQLG